MPRQNIPVTRPGLGVTPTEVTPVAVDDCSFVNDGQTILVCRNSGGAPDTATVVTPALAGGLAIADAPITVAAGAIGYIGPFNPVLFNQPDGTVFVDVTTALMRFAAISAAR